MWQQGVAATQPSLGAAMLVLAGFMPGMSVAPSSGRDPQLLQTHAPAACQRLDQTSWPLMDARLSAPCPPPQALSLALRCAAGAFNLTDAAGVSKRLADVMAVWRSAYQGPLAAVQRFPAQDGAY